MAYRTIDYIKIFDYEKCIVIGNGESAVKCKEISNDIFTIGVNNIWKIFNPNILFLVDPRANFDMINNHAESIENTKMERYVVMDDEWKLPVENTFLFRRGNRHNLMNLDIKHTIDTGYDSPYMGIQLAYKLNFKKIGLLGVDYTPNHFYAEDGDHGLFGKLHKINKMYGNLTNVLHDNGIKVYNLNKNSNLKTIPFDDLENF
jgi:hypothetical protein